MLARDGSVVWVHDEADPARRGRRAAARRPADRRQRPQGGRGAPAAPRRPRRADRDAQPPPLHGGARARGRGRPPRHALELGDRARHRRLQARQRLASATRRATSCCARSPPCSPSACAPATPSPASAATSSPACCAARSSEGAEVVAGELLAHAARAPRSRSADDRRAGHRQRRRRGPRGGRGRGAEAVLSAADVAMYEGKHGGPRPRRALHAARCAPSSSAGGPGSRSSVDALEHDRFALFAQPVLDLRTGRGRPARAAAAAARRGRRAWPGRTRSCRWRSASTSSRRSTAGCSCACSRCCATRSPADLVFEVNLAAALDRRRPGDPAAGARARHRRLRPVTIDRRGDRDGGDREHAGGTGRSPTTLARLGVRMALDDFGSGFGSFYYLKHLPVDYLKIDGEFIAGLPANPVDQEVVKAIVMLARAVGRRTIAEFVPDQATQELLAELRRRPRAGLPRRPPAPGGGAVVSRARCWSPTRRTCSTAGSSRCPTRSRAPTGTRSTRCSARSTRRCGASSATSRARSSCASGRSRPTTASRRSPPTTPTARRCPTRWRRSGRRRPGLYEALGWKVHDARRARGRRPHALAVRGRDRGGRALLHPHRRPRHVPVRERDRARADAGRPPAGARRHGPGRGGRALRRDARAGAGLHRAARRPVRRAARREGHRARRPPPSCCSARATSST